MFKILHTGDIHARDKDIDEVKKCLAFIVETARKEEPGLIVDAGDTVDSQNIKLDSASAKLIFEVFSQLADIAPVAVVTGTPLHDGHAVEVLKHVKARYPVHVATRPEQIFLRQGNFISNVDPDDWIADAHDAIISFVPTPTKQFFNVGSIEHSDQGIAGAMAPMFAGFGAAAADYDCPHILIGHFQTKGARVSNGQTLIGRDIEISRDHLSLANADLICLAHIHMAQEFMPGGFFCGSVYRENHGETEAKGFYVHHLGWADEGRYSVMSDFIETPAKKLFSEKISLVDGTDSITLKSVPLDEIEGASVKIDVEVWQDEADSVDLEDVKQHYLAEGAESVTVNLVRKPRENVRSQKIMELQSLRDKVRERALLNREEVSEDILTMCDRLESESPEDIIKAVAAG